MRGPLRYCPRPDQFVQLKGQPCLLRGRTGCGSQGGLRLWLRSRVPLGSRLSLARQEAGRGPLVSSPPSALLLSVPFLTSGDSGQPSGMPSASLPSAAPATRGWGPWAGHAESSLPSQESHSHSLMVKADVVDLRGPFRWKKGAGEGLSDGLSSFGTW